LITLGFTPEAIRHQLRSRRLFALWHSVYAIGRPEVTRHGEFMAATLACGPDAVISHHSAAELWRMGLPEPEAIHVSVLAGFHRRHRGIVVHRRVALGPEDVTVCDGIPVTSPTCTLIDLAPSSTRAELERAINESDKHDLVIPERLRTELESVPGRAGVKKLRVLLDERTFVLTDSELERRFMPIAVRAELPRPQTQCWVNGYRVDFYWPALRLVVETDGLRYHRTPAQQARDRERDQAHVAAGLTVLRFTHGQIAFGPSHVQSILEAVKARLLN
jgi:very-short-patch-repair endonuclease